MKKIIAVISALVLIMSVFAACSAGDSNTYTNAEQTSTSTNADASLADIIADIYEKHSVGFMVCDVPVEIDNSDSLKSCTGLDSAEKISDVAVSESAMGSQAYSLVLVRLNDESDAQTVAEQMKSGINPAKWVCVQADDIRVVSSGNVIMLIMVSTDLSETVTADQIVDAFTETCGPLTVDI